jgi:hypothetical protein
MKDAEIEAEIEDFLEGLQSADLSRHAGHDGVQVVRWSTSVALAVYRDCSGLCYPPRALPEMR